MGDNPSRSENATAGGLGVTGRHAQGAGTGVSPSSYEEPPFGGGGALPKKTRFGMEAGFKGLSVAAGAMVWRMLGPHMSGLLRDDEVAERVDAHGEAGVYGDGRAELLDDGGAAEGVAGVRGERGVVWAPAPATRTRCRGVMITFFDSASRCLGVFGGSFSWLS